VIDRALVIGALLFGVGWGSVGFCPGPGIEALVLDMRAWIFVGAMVAGMLAHRWWSGRRRADARDTCGEIGA
jgi:uncharacterized membrane protein YedE/YeeE